MANNMSFFCNGDASVALAAHLADLNDPHQVEKSDVDLSNVDNTSDVNKPVSTAQAAADALKATTDENASFKKLLLAEEALLATPVAGKIEFANGKFYITNQSHQTAIDRTRNVALATVEVVDSDVETTLFTAPMASNSLEAGNIFKIHCDGVMTNDSGASGDEVVIRVRVGGVVKITLETNTREMTDEDWHLNANSTQRTIGATGSRAIHAHLSIGDPTSTGDEASLIGIETIDTTANMDVTVTAQWNTAETNNTIKLYQGYVEYKN